MSRGRWPALLAILLAAVLTAGFFLKPVQGPPRNLSLTGDVTRGNYLIRLSGCSACHTDMAGYLAGGAPIPTPFGIFYPPNITPDRRTGIGTWTLAQFSDALSNGDGPHGNLYPAFPYNDLSLMSDQEVVDLYAAIFAAPAIDHQAPPNRVVFPLNFRILVSGWKNLFFRPHRYQDDPTHSAEWNRGAYLANGLAHCVACHSPANALGAIEDGRHFAGNPAGGSGGKAPSILATALLADGYDASGLARTLKTGITPNAGRVGKEMAPVIADETSRWTDADLAAISTYLLSGSN